MKKKKIVFITNRLGGGGSERVLTLLSNSFNKMNYEVCIFYYNTYNKEYVTECKVKQICDESVENNLIKILKLRKCLKNEKPDIIIAFEYFINIRAIIASIGLKSKLIISERNDPNKLNNRKIAKRIRDILYKFCDILVCQTPDAKKYFSYKIQEKTFIIPNPIKADLPMWNFEESTNDIITFCRLEKQKNIPLLIDSFELFYKEFPNYNLHIYGEGKEKNNIDKIIERKNLTNAIKIHNFSENIHEIASKCRMFVLSSDYEGLSNSMLEAMAMGMPVIATDCPIGGARMVIKSDLNGVLVECRNSIEMSNAMNKIAKDEEYAKRLSRNASKIKDDLCLENILNLWIKVFFLIEE